MGEIKHTKGPFHHEESGAIRGPDGRMVGRAYLGAELVDGGKEKRLANARLFAAAPEMKEALEQLLGNAEIAYRQMDDSEESGFVASALLDTILQARDALAKANGEAA